METTTLEPAWLSTFEARAEAAGARLYRAASMAEAADLIAQVAAAHDHNSLATSTWQAGQDEPGWQELLARLRKRLEIVLLAAPGEIAAAPLGISRPDLAVAETGSLVFATNDLPSRLVAMLSYIHIAVVTGAQLVESLDQAGERIREWQTGRDDRRRYVSMVTGPSRTADIERVLTIGVQGPQELHIVVVA